MMATMKACRATIEVCALAMAVAGALACLSGQARAAVPGTIGIQGALLTAAGGPVSDGDYPMTFALFAVEKGGTALWSETQVVTVSKGVFSHILGSVKAMPAGVFAGPVVWLSLKAGSEPEMPRRRFHAVAMARRAAMAEGLSCTGCVSMKALKADGDLDLGGHALKVKKLTAADVAAGTLSAGTLSAGTLSATTLQGDGSKITGIKIPSGECKAKGQVVKGIHPDGTLKCVASMDPAGLPADGLDEISNGLLSNQFTDEVFGTKGVVIADNNPTGVSDTLDFPDIGTAQALDVLVDLANSDISTVTVWLFDPNNLKYVLYEKGGKGTVLKGVWPSSNKTLSGDLTTWVGKNPKGKWRLQVIDTGFKNNGQDGQVSSWSVRIKTLSSKKVQSKGVLEATGGLRFQAAAKPPVTCSTAQIGYAYYNTTEKNLYICNGKEFDLAVKAPLGSVNKAAANCQAIVNAGDAKGSGVYWLDPDGPGGAVPKFQAWCNMDLDGGGWMLVFNLDTSDGVTRSWFDTTFWQKDSSVGSPTAPMVGDHKNGSVFAYVKANEILIQAHAGVGNYKGKPAWARYTIQAAHKSKTMKQLLNLAGNTLVATLAQRTGAIAKNAYTRNAGDVFIDHGLPIIVNSTAKAGTDADNRVRFGTDFKPLCSKVECNGHNVQGGYGGYHDRNNSYPLTYEAMPSFGYHPGPMGFGTDFKNNNGCGNSVWSNKCNPTSAILHVDFAIYVR